jgi:hypothetical protein
VSTSVCRAVNQIGSREDAPAPICGGTAAASTTARTGAGRAQPPPTAAAGRTCRFSGRACWAAPAEPALARNHAAGHIKRKTAGAGRTNRSRSRPARPPHRQSMSPLSLHNSHADHHVCARRRPSSSVVIFGGGGARRVALDANLNFHASVCLMSDGNKRRVLLAGAGAGPAREHSCQECDCRERRPVPARARMSFGAT